MGPVSKNIGMDEEKNQKIQFEYFAGKSDFLIFFLQYLRPRKTWVAQIFSIGLVFDAESHDG